MHCLGERRLGYFTQSAATAIQFCINEKWILSLFLTSCSNRLRLYVLFMINEYIKAGSFNCNYQKNHTPFNLEKIMYV